MPVQCAKCGEELMGAVNRCWRCGQAFVARSTQDDRPPIRRSPVADGNAEVFAAELANTTHGPAIVQDAASPVESHRPALKVRRGSPFADRGTATLEPVGQESDRSERREPLEREARYHKSGGATASAALVIPVGVLSFIAAFLFPLAGILLAILGLGLGVWGLLSRRRGLAIAGLLLCCVSLATAIFNGGVALYTSLYGAAPW